MAKKAIKSKSAAPKPKAGGSGRALVIVESPTKAKTIRKFLPAGYQVEACVGHIRDLPASAKEIPEKYKKEKWASLGINVDADFTPLYVIPPAKQKIIKNLKDLLNHSTELILATDEDREGESISHHLVEVLKPSVPTKRMVFHEITKSAIQEALQNFREVDMKLVQAQESRRILDRLVGYSLSPLLWKKIAYGLSAGRVQSVAVRLIVEREEERLKFKKAIYCGLIADLQAKKGSFEAKIQRWDGKRVATGKDFDEHTGKIAVGKDAFLLVKSQAEEIQRGLQYSTFKVIDITEKPLNRRPSPPFITSTLQQEANRKLGLSARDAMRTAQSLYENGWITYMRTDSVFLSKEAIGAARKHVGELYGADYLPEAPRYYESKSKSAQEAHEAIRPAGSQWSTPQETGLRGIELSLYDLIWKRAVASQMADAKQLSVSVTVEAGKAEFGASGTRILFPGFLRAYVEGADDADAALAEKEVLLPDLKVGDELKLNDLKVTEHETKPPPRFTEASLVQTLEKEGVGRPSTYASIISTIIDRGYVRRVQNALVPTFTAFAVNQLLRKHFPELVDLKFTAELEGSLDEIAEGKRKHLEFLKDFFLKPKTGLREQIEKREKQIDPEEARAIQLEGFENIAFRIGRFGPYFEAKVKGEAEPVRVSIPEEIAPADLDQSAIDDLIQAKKDGPPNLGIDPETNLPVFSMTGRYGPYLQLGDGEKAKRMVIPKGVDPKGLSLEQALGYLRLPRKLGQDEQGHDVLVGLGRFGPYVMRKGGSLEKPEYRSLKKEDDILTVGLKRAIDIFNEPRVRGKRAKASALKTFGDHPTLKKPIELFNGPYGPYVKCAKTNASVPKEMNPEDLTLEQAVQLIDARLG